MDFVKVGILAMILAVALPAAEHNVLTPAESAAGWKLLFDGKTMNGWTDPTRMNPAGDAWSVEDGCLKANKHPRIREDLLTKETFRDFELTFEWRISKAGNSGLKYRIQDTVFLDSTKVPKNAKRFEDMVGYEMEHHLGSRATLAPNAHSEDYPVGFEYQTIDNEGHPDGRRGGSHATGALYDMVAPTRQMARPVGEFNQSRIVLRGNHVEHWLNGEKVVDTMLDAPEIEKAVTARWKGTGVYDLLVKQPKKDCPIGLQNHDDAAWFRDIKIRPMTSTAIMDRIRTLRRVPDEQRGAVTSELALAIRNLPAGEKKLGLASSLANLSTEGDFGKAALQEVAATLAQALREEHPSDQNPYVTLAQLERYEGVKAPLDAPELKAALARLAADDELRRAADFTLMALDGKQWNLKSLRGKVVLLNFWATWCPPCRKEMPDLQLLYARFKAQGLVVLAISDEEPAKVRPFVAEKNYTYPILLDPDRKANDAFIVEGIPKSFVYNRDGQLSAQAIDMRTQRQFLEMLAKAGLR